MRRRLAIVLAAALLVSGVFVFQVLLERSESRQARAEGPAAPPNAGRAKPPAELVEAPAQPIPEQAPQRDEVRAPEPAAQPVAAAPHEGAETKSYATVTGRCIGPDGIGVGGAHVRCGKGEGVLSAGDGSFSLRVDLYGELRASRHLAADRDGYGGTSREVLLRAGETSDLGDLLLEAVGRVAGRVVDDAGQPRAGASVALEEGLALQQGSRFSGPFHPLATGKAADDGSFELQGPVGSARVWAGGEGLAWTSSATVELAANHRVDGVEIVVPSLDAEDTIELDVLDPAGDPVPLADVRYFTRTGGSSSSGSFQADAHGHVKQFVGLRGPHTFMAFDPQHRWRPAVLREVQPGARGLVLQLSERAVFRVRVRDTGRHPIEDFRVTLQGTEDDVRDSGGGVEQGVHENGEVEVVLPVVPFRVIVEAEGFQLAELGPFEPDAVPDPLLVTLEGLPGVRGRVTGGGEPLAGARVSLHEAIDADETLVVNGFPCRSKPYPEVQGRSEDDGVFSLTLRKAGRWFLRAEAPGWAPTDVGPFELDPARGGDELAIDLGKGGRITGEVLLDGNAEPGGWIVGASRADGFGFTTRTDASGRFTFDGLAPGGWLVRRCEQEISTNSTSSSSSKGDGTSAPELPWSCQVHEGRTTNFDLDLRDLERIELAGRFALSGASVSGWHASLWPEGTGSATGGAQSDEASLDADGTFLLRTNLTGRFQVGLRGELPSGAVIDVHDSVQLDEGSNAWEHLLPSGRIEGHAAPGALAEGSSVELLWQDGELTVHAGVPPRPDGTFELPAFPAGSVRVFYRLAIGERTERSLQVIAGQTVLLTLP